MDKEMLSYFNLHQNPFHKEIAVQDLLRLPSFETVLKKLELLISTKGIGVMTGKSGGGKSCLIRILIESLNPGLYKPVYLCHTTVSATEFYTHLAVKLGLESVNRKAPLFRAIKDNILSLNKTSRIHPILIIDEAHMLRSDILAEIRMLTNFEVDSYNALTILLCGQESLNQKFGLSILESLVNSITVNIQVEGLKEEEVFSYIENRISVSGNSAPLFSKNAMKLIHQSSGGILRIVNTIALSALFKIYILKTQVVEAEHVNSILTR